MDIFRNESERALGKQIFQNTPLQYELLEISSRVSTETHLSRGLLQTAKLRRGTLEWADAESTSPSLILVKVDFEAAAQQKLYTTANDILLLFRCLELDTCMLYMMYRDIMGFHQVSFRQSIRSPNETVFNFFVNIEPLKVLWSFNATNLATKGIVLTRATPGGRSCYHDFCRLLDQYSRLMAYPLFPAFAVVLEVVAFSDKIVNEQEEVVAQTELKTGFSPWSLDVRYNFTRLADLDKLSFISQKMGATLVELESVMWYMKTMQRIITSFQGHGSQDWSAYASEAGKAFIHSAHQDISQVLSLIRPQSEYTELYIGYLRERAKNQLSVVFNLITRGDAQVNINLAQLVKADGSSMNVIAIMTMVFLPGTFFATLFSVPSLQWGRSPVIQSNFWVYWAFTLPCTTAVFFLWLIFTKIYAHTWKMGPRQRRGKPDKTEVRYMYAEERDYYISKAQQ